MADPEKLVAAQPGTGGVPFRAAPSAQDLEQRRSVLRRGIILEYVSIALAFAESMLAISAGVIAGSIALLGFGLDSVIEIVSSTALVWRFSHDTNEARRERVENVTLRIVGCCFLALAAYVSYESVATLINRVIPQRSIFGIVVLALSFVAMIMLRRAKREVGVELRSDAMKADARQTEFCAYLSLIALGGLGFNALFGFWWADPAAALAMVPLIIREGVEAVQGKACAHG